MNHWDFHPKVRSGAQLSRGERAADVLKRWFGTWAFLGTVVGFIGGWMVLQSVLLRNHGFDPYPWLILNLALSCIAAMQGGALQISANRGDRISGELAQHDYEVNVASLRYHMVQSAVLLEVAEKAGIELTAEQRAALLAPAPIPLPPPDTIPSAVG